MKRSFKTLLKSPMMIVFIFIVIFFTPVAIFSPGENKDRAVVTAVGIDKAGDGVEVSLLTFIPTANPTYNETNSVVSASGQCIADALHQAQIAMGKRIGLSHAKTTIIGASLLQEDISPSIDYLSRIASLSENTILISTNGNAKDFLKASQCLGEDLGLKLEQLVAYNVQKIYVSDTTLESFYQGYYSPVKSSLIGYLELKDEQSSEIASMESGQSGSSSCSGGDSNGGSGEGESSSGSNSGQSGGSSGGSGGGNSGGEEGGSAGGEQASGGQSQGKQKIVNNGDALLLKEGRKVEVLNEKAVQGLNITNSKAIGQLIEIKHVTNQDFDDAKLTYAVRKKQVNTALKMENGNPIYSISVTLGVELIEIVGSKNDMKLNSLFTILTPEVSSKIEAYCKEEFTSALKIIREHKADVLGLTLMMQTAGGEFKEFYNNLEDKEDILNHVNFQLTVRCKSE